MNSTTAAGEGEKNLGLGHVMNSARPKQTSPVFFTPPLLSLGPAVCFFAPVYHSNSWNTVLLLEYQLHFKCLIQGIHTTTCQIEGCMILQKITSTYINKPTLEQNNTIKCTVMQIVLFLTNCAHYKHKLFLCLKPN